MAQDRFHWIVRKNRLSSFHSGLKNGASRVFFRIVTSATMALSLLNATPAMSQSGQEAAFVLGLMESVNTLSVRFNREVCGYILRHSNGAYSSTKVSWGAHATCA